MAFTALTHTRASALPSRSMALAALQHHQRIASISMRARETTSMFLPRRRAACRRPRGQTPLDHQLEGLLGGTDRAHAVVDAARAEAELGDLEAATLAEQHVVLGHPHVGEAQVHVAVGGVVVAEHVHRAEDLDAGRVHGHQDLGLLLVGCGASGLVRTMTIMILQRGSPAPEM
jgi:hypothetical protein